MVSDEYLRQFKILQEESFRLRKKLGDLDDLSWIELTDLNEVRIDGYLNKEQLQLIIDSINNIQEEFK